MPYAKTKDGSLVNEVTLGDGYPLSNDLQPLKVGGEASPIEMSTSLPDNSDNGKVKVRGDLEVTGGLNFKNDVEVDLSFDDLSLSGDLDVAGNVGIGTTSPTAPLDVAGDTLVDSAGTDTLLNLSQTLNSPSGDNSGVATETYSMIKGNVTNTDSAGWDNKYLLQLQTGGTDKLKSDLSGNVTSAGTVTSSAGVCQGPQKYIFQTSARAYTQNNNWYFPNSTYGLNYHQWNSTEGSSSLPSYYWDSWNPLLIVPVDMVINEYYYYGNTSGRDNTFELTLMKGTGVAWDDTHNDHFSMSTVGTTQSGDWTANSYNKIGQTGLSVSVSAGDAIIPHHRRTTNNDSTTEYMEIVFVVVCTIS